MNNKETAEYLPDTFVVKVPQNLEDQRKITKKLRNFGNPINYYDKYLDVYLICENGEFFFDIGEFKKLISFNDFINKSLPFQKIGLWLGYEICKSAGTNKIKIGCQGIPFDEFSLILNSLDKNFTICNAFDEKETTVSIFPQKKRICFCVDGEYVDFSFQEIKKLKTMLNKK